MSESSFNIESATNGLVLALFLAATLFLGVMLYYVLRDIDERESSGEPQRSARVHLAPVHPASAERAPLYSPSRA